MQIKKLLPMNPIYNIYISFNPTFLGLLRHSPGNLVPKVIYYMWYLFLKRKKSTDHKGGLIRNIFAFICVRWYLHWGLKNVSIIIWYTFLCYGDKCLTWHRNFGFLSYKQGLHMFSSKWVGHAKSILTNAHFNSCSWENWASLAIQVIK